MIPIRKSPAHELRDFIHGWRLAVELGDVPDSCLASVESADRALDALLSEKMSAPPASVVTVVNFVAAARQLAAAVETGTVGERHKAQACNLNLKGRAVAETIEAWTAGGQREPKREEP